MASDPNTRRTFIKTVASTGLGLGLGGLAAAAPLRPEVYSAASFASGSEGISTVRPRPPGQKPVHALTTAPTAKIRVGVIGLNRGMGHVNDLSALDFVEVTALCDLRRERAERAARRVKERRGNTPEIYAGSESAWEQLVAREDLDAVYVATPWEWHAPMCLKALELGKHVFVEVSAAVTVDECWALVDASERAQRHCVILENCCYGENELFILNLVRNGVFGDLHHAECAYIHDLRGVLFQLGSEGDWRREYHKRFDGNLYPTHGLGPICQSLGIGRGDQFKFLVSTSSPERGLTRHLLKKNPNGGRHAGEKYLCGDMNTSLVKTERGLTIMVQHDVVSPRPYSRINALCGTEATFFDYPARLALDTPRKYGLSAKGSGAWLNAADMQKMRNRFTHPLIRGLAASAKGAGHGGMDFVMNYRLMDCLRRGWTPDMTVYDAAAWSSLLEISTRSVAAGSAPVPIPDFTRGAWKTQTPLGIVEVGA
ncbi:MAG: Gfo/Idh/MocA family oxidoreductase [Puniceicoccales bacterium]|nr:Gfo/Idh/MocA family oxidoreductase [Puniceicoccales bacterium]